MIFSNRSVLTLMMMLAAGLARAQEGPPSQYERVKGLEPFIGFWQGDFQPPDGPDGTLTGFCRWTSNRSYAQFQWLFQPNDGERMHVVTVIFGWNGKDKCLNAWNFVPEGQGNGRASLEGSVLSIAWRGTTADGQETSSDVSYEISGDKLTVTVKNRKVGDQDRPGFSFTVEKRERRQRGGR